MATRYFCDRCGEEVRCTRNLANLRIGRPEDHNRNDLNYAIEKDICPACYKALQEWAKPIVTKKEN